MVYKYVAVVFLSFANDQLNTKLQRVNLLKTKYDTSIFIPCINELFHYYYYDSLNLQLHVIFEKKKKMHNYINYKSFKLQQFLSNACVLLLKMLLEA